MTITLPAPIAAYYRAERDDDPEALAACFAENGIVHDEGATRQGRPAIAAWMADAKARYRHGTEVLDAEMDGATVAVSVRVSGHFPNSPVMLRQKFHLADGTIQRLEIS